MAEANKIFSEQHPIRSTSHYSYSAVVSNTTLSIPPVQPRNNNPQPEVINNPNHTSSLNSPLQKSKTATPPISSHDPIQNRLVLTSNEQSNEHPNKLSTMKICSSNIQNIASPSTTTSHLSKHITASIFNSDHSSLITYTLTHQQTASNLQTNSNETLLTASNLKSKNSSLNLNTQSITTETLSNSTQTPMSIENITTHYEKMSDNDNDDI